MIFQFEDFVLDPGRRELRRADASVLVEPQVFDLLIFLIRNRERVVTKSDLLDAIWNGRVVSESTLTSRINAARTAVGDSGEAQRLIRTVRGRGFRFVGDVRESEEYVAASVPPESEGIPRREREAQTARSLATTALSGIDRSSVRIEPRRASVAIMPFRDMSHLSSIRGGIGDGFAHDIITRLAKLRSLFVIAQGTVFALHERNVGPEDAGRALNVDYVVSGSLQQRETRLIVEVELAETRSGRIAWTETFDQKLDDAFQVLDEIGDRIVTSIASEIELIERNRAILTPPNSLDAWEAHHRGLWHMYRFNQADNIKAQKFFKTAVGLDPTFARAYAGLSFTHWQSAFQGWADRRPEIDLAFEAAGQSLMADDRDPAAHWAMGRALWLRGSQDQSLVELTRAVDLSPNFALGHYTLAFVHSQTGDPAAAVHFSDLSRHLSPFDPLLFAMLGARSMALVRLNQFDEAAEWGVKAAARPNAHPHIHAIAAYSLALAGRLDEARTYIAAIHRILPTYRVDDFLTAMQFAPEGAALFRRAAKRIEGTTPRRR